MTCTKTLCRQPNIDAVAECMLFATADAKYEAYVAVSDLTPTSLQTRLSDYTGTFELSQTESEIFGIEPEDVSALYWAYERYENLIGTMDSYFLEFRDQERIDHAQFFRGELVWSFDAALGFMTNACKLPATKCISWLCKIIAANIRSGLYNSSVDL